MHARSALNVALLFLLATLAACAPRETGAPRLRIEGAWVRPAGGGASSAAYFRVLNGGSRADTLLGIHSDLAAHADIHLSRIEDGIARMLPVPRLAVPAHGHVDLAPGGYHAMLMGLKRDLRPGESVLLTLHFRHSGELPLEAPVREAPPR